jgi:hypothetical protein
MLFAWRFKVRLQEMYEKQSLNELGALLASLHIDNKGLDKFTVFSGDFLCDQILRKAPGYTVDRLIMTWKT